MVQDPCTLVHDVQAGHVNTVFDFALHTCVMDHVLC